MKGRKGNRALRARKTDPAKRAKPAPRPAGKRAKPAPRPAGKRAKKPTRVEAAEQRARDAQERARAFAASRSSVVIPPFMLSNRQYAGAVAIWNYHEPMLRERHFWQPQFIAPFTGFCVYYDEFIAADREVKKKGWGVEGKSTSGGHRFWKNPAVDVRDHAFARVLELSTRYAFTPLDLYKLERESAAAASSRPGGPRQPESDKLPLEGGAETPEPPVSGGPGALNAFDGTPPIGERIN